MRTCRIGLVAILAMVLALALLGAACTKKAGAPESSPPALSPTAGGTTPAPTAAKPDAKTDTTPATGPLEPMIVLQKNCAQDTISEKMVYVKNKGGVLSQVVYQNGAFLAKIPEGLLPEINTWTDYAVLVNSTDGFDKLPLTPECRTKVNDIVGVWAKEMEKMKAAPTAPAAATEPGN